MATIAVMMGGKTVNQPGMTRLVCDQWQDSDDKVCDLPSLAVGISLHLCCWHQILQSLEYGNPAERERERDQVVHCLSTAILTSESTDRLAPLTVYGMTAPFSRDVK